MRCCEGKNWRSIWRRKQVILRTRLEMRSTQRSRKQMMVVHRKIMGVLKGGEQDEPKTLEKKLLLLLQRRPPLQELGC
jgi:hypothetical protein